MVPGALEAPEAPEAKTEKRRRTRSLPHDGHSRAVSTALMERRCSKGCSQPRQMYS
jgi:hypothetical protein